MKLFVPVLISVCLLSFAIGMVYAVDKVETVYFSIKAPDNWIYQTGSTSAMASLMGYGTVNHVLLVPSEFGDLMTTEDTDDFNEKMQVGGASAVFTQDPDYSIKNAPLDTYVSYMEKQLNAKNITSQQDSVVGKEKAVKVLGNETDTNVNYVGYLMLHDKDPYYILFTANAKDYDKYLPEFETMVKSFRFVD